MHLASLFKMHVHEHQPFNDTSPDVPDDDVIDWQGWVKTTGVWDDTRGQYVVEQARRKKIQRSTLLPYKILDS